MNMKTEYTYKAIVDLSNAGRTGKEIAELVGLQQPEDSTIDADRYLTNAGCALLRQAKLKVLDGNGGLVIGTRHKNPANSPNRNASSHSAMVNKEIGLILADQTRLFAVRFLCAKHNITPKQREVRSEIESGGAFASELEALLGDSGIYELACRELGVRTEEERHAEQIEFARAFLCQQVDKLVMIKRHMETCKAFGIEAKAPAWCGELHGISKDDIDNMEGGAVKDLFDRVNPPAEDSVNPSADQSAN